MPKILQISDRGVGAEPGIGAAQVLGHFGMQLGEALDVHLVDQRLVPGDQRRPVVAPGEGLVENRGQRRELGVVAIVERQIGLLDRPRV